MTIEELQTKVNRFIHNILKILIFITLGTFLIQVSTTSISADLMLPGWEKYYDQYKAAQCPIGQITVECNFLSGEGLAGCSKYQQNPQYEKIAEFKYDTKYCVRVTSAAFWGQLFTAIGLTVVIELVVWLLAGVRTGNYLILIGGVNILTVSLAHLGVFANLGSYGMAVLIMELVVIGIELAILGWMLGKTISKKKVIMVTAIANIISYVSGLILNFIFKMYGII